MGDQMLRANIGGRALAGLAKAGVLLRRPYDPDRLTLHQTWRSAELPRRYADFRDSWLKHNPGWKYRFWSDADLRRLVATHRPEFLPTFDGYSDPICRIDAAQIGRA